METRAKSRNGQAKPRQKPSGNWEAHRWLGDLGRRVTATGPTENKALKALDAKITAIRMGDQVAVRAKITFKEYAQRVIAQRQGIGKRTTDLYETTLKDYLGPLHHLKLDEIKPATLRALYTGLKQKGLSDTVRHHAHTLARLVLETARHDGLIGKNPADVPGVKPKAERGAEGEAPAAYTREQVKLLLASAPGTVHWEVVAFLLLTGMRRGEAMALRWNAVDLDKGVATVRLTRSVSGSEVYEGSPKTRQARRDVPLSAEATALLKGVAQTNCERRAMWYPDKPASPYVFPTVDGTPPRPDNVRRILHQVVDRANKKLLEAERQRAEAAREKPRDIELLPKLRVHHLRHTFVSMMAARGVRLEVIAQWIGDNPATVMKIYLHVFKQDTAMPTLGLLGPASEETTGDAKEPDQDPGEQPTAAD